MISEKVNKVNILVYDEQSKQKLYVPITLDDQNFQVKCKKPLHEFAPSARECACGKIELVEGKQ